MRKKIISISLAGILACGLFAGCGRKEIDKDPGTETQTVESGKTNEAKELTSDIPEKITESRENAEYTSAQDFSEKLFAEGCMEEENPLLSPVSVYLALSFAGSGAGGETAAEFQKILGENSTQVSEKIRNRLPAQKEDLKVVLANSAWVDTGMDVKEEFLSTAKNSFGAQVFQTELARDRTMRDINWWIQDNTSGLIRDFLSAPLQEGTMLALFQTIYLKGKWVVPFEALDTYERPFTLDDRNVVNVPTMNLYGKQLSYIRKEHCEGVVLPYRDSSLVFVALKPVGGVDAEEGGISVDSALKVRGLYRALDMGQIGTLIEEAQTGKVNLHLPKFQVSFDRELNDDLKRMGLEKAFVSDAADFSGIGTAKDGSAVYLSLVRQKAIFILDEEGTEAAAVTQVTMEVGAVMGDQEEPVELDFNEPFLYLVFDKEADLPLFIGIMDNPPAADK